MGFRVAESEMSRPKQDNIMATHFESDGCLANGDYESYSTSTKLEESMIHPKQDRISLRWTIEVIILKHIHKKIPRSAIARLIQQGQWKMKIVNSSMTAIPLLNPSTLVKSVLLDTSHFDLVPSTDGYWKVIIFTFISAG
ncbi:unnamed protein product [Hymenolepis diminuta]|uniref:Reverse transcriptase n=1 Tax=Hymenolepis diminuta TaxID=6216 RepID=A0A0R3SI54_HYMDI|nr:unnamed protein product [Hymenolepis diminuta]